MPILWTDAMHAKPILQHGPNKNGEMAFVEEMRGRFLHLVANFSITMASSFHNPIRGPRSILKHQSSPDLELVKGPWLPHQIGHEIFYETQKLHVIWRLIRISYIVGKGMANGMPQHTVS